MENSRFQSVTDVQNFLKVLAEENPGGGVAFDADGTLWRHDIGVVAFEYFCKFELIRDAARDKLLLLADQFSLQLKPNESPSRWAAQLNQAHQHGLIDEKTICEMQVWIYAGYSQRELAPYFAKALELSNHQSQIFPEMLLLLNECRRLDLRPIVVSASPLPVLEVALSPHLFTLKEIAGGSLTAAGTVYQSELSAPLPYGIEKAKAGRALLGERPWLMALGDSAFDLDMMFASQVGISIGRKAGLEKALTQSNLDGKLLRIEEPKTQAELVRT